MSGEPLTVIGLMMGTSVDGVDAAVTRIADTEDGLRLALLHYQETPIAPDLRRRILALLRPESSRVDEVCEVNVLVGEALAAAGEAAARRAGVQTDLVASHGQTVWHQVEPGHTRSTLQIGEPSVIAERLGATVVADFRPRDIAAGGQGAPLASYVDVLLFGADGRARAIQNIGGIGNVTWVPADNRWEAALAFDTGPGNVLIDLIVARVTEGQQQYDADGALAARGTPDESLLSELLAHPYFEQQPPKTTGRELYSAPYAEAILESARQKGLSDADVVATATALTARSIAEQYRRFLPGQPEEVVVSGGGSKNPTLMRMLGELVAPARVRVQGEFGLPSSGREAAYFAVLGYQALHGRTNTLPGCTGARHAVPMGKILPGRNYASLVRRVAHTPPLDVRRLTIQEPRGEPTLDARSI